MKSARRRARELAVQGLYQWQLNATDPTLIADDLKATRGFEQADEKHFRGLLHGVIEHAADLHVALAPLLDRTVKELSPVEHALLLLSAFELRDHAQTPYKVVINEAIELAKSFGGTDGHKYVNAMLNGIAPQLRAPEIANDRAPSRSLGGSKGKAAS